MNNLFKYENTIRISIGIVLITIASSLSLWLIFPIGLVMIYTGVSSHCPIYAALNINEEQALENYYLSQLPKYNPEPMFLFDKEGNLKFTNIGNSSSLKDKIDIKSVLNPLKPEECIYSEMNHLQSYESDGQNYMVHFKCVKDIDSILAYAFNATDLVKLQDEIISTQKEIVYKMGEIGETRSKETGNHVKRVAEYSYLLAKLSGFSEEEAELLKMASPMHDIGKVGIPDSVLKKPGKLDEDEWQIMKTHAQIGFELLQHSQRPILKAACIVANEHHEKWDGSGYPNSKRGEEIHIYGRITAVADVFDALGSERVYKKAWELERILELFSEQSNKHFDPRLIELFFTNIDAFLTIREQYKD
jgi:response regulator RpfG family c-di-GMP phosphodiesterase